MRKTDDPMLQLELEQDFFYKGAPVEVNPDEPGFRGSWFTARVVRPVTQKTRMICVQYDTLLDDDDPTKPLKESVNVLCVRPPAPREARRKFKLNEEVNAFHNDAWWEGVITGVVGEGKEQRFSVFFRGSREQIEFGPEELRLHREWNYNNWYPPLEEDGGDGDGDGDGGDGAGPSGH